MNVTSSGDAVQGCSRLEWDSAFFGYGIARVDPEALRRPDALEAWCERARIDCLYLLADVGDQAAIDAAQDLGFRLVDLRVTLEVDDSDGGPPGLGSSGFQARTAGAEDGELLKAVARGSYHDTRFHVDTRFDRARSEALYETWIEKSCHGWADHVLVIEVDRAIAGFVTCHRGDGVGSIGLVGVDAAFRGRGVGLALMAEARRWFTTQGMPRVRVVTQGRNTGGLRLYQKAGFSVRLLQLWYHKWLRPTDDV